VRSSPLAGSTAWRPRRARLCLVLPMDRLRAPGDHRLVSPRLLHAGLALVEPHLTARGRSRSARSLRTLLAAALHLGLRRRARPTGLRVCGLALLRSRRRWNIRKLVFLAAGKPLPRPGLCLALTRYCFTSKLYQRFIVGVNHPFIAPPPLANPTLLQYYCTTIAQYTPPPTDPFCVCHTPYSIGNGNIVQRPSLFPDPRPGLSPQNYSPLGSLELRLSPTARYFIFLRTSYVFIT